MIQILILLTFLALLDARVLVFLLFQRTHHRDDRMENQTPLGPCPIPVRYYHFSACRIVVTHRALRVEPRSGNGNVLGEQFPVEAG
tara:strand:+ start:143 stop:400 length:258 start_codon:yes stop_codon:yes gene_type:complete